MGDFMSSLIVSGDTSGAITLSAPAVAGSGVLTLPVTTDTLVGKATTDTLTNKTLTNPIIAGTPTGVGVLTSDTAQATTSGTYKDFTGIPSWVKRITVMFNEVSTNGTSNQQIQIGSGSLTTSGYVSSSSGVSAAGVGVTSYTNGFGLRNELATYVFSGHMVLTLVSGNIWVSSHSGKGTTAITMFGGGSVTISGTLDRVRITTVNGTDAFDAGSINLLYE
jgi:hypothetical protein